VRGIVVHGRTSVGFLPRHNRCGVRVILCSIAWLMASHARERAGEGWGGETGEQVVTTCASRAIAAQVAVRGASAGMAPAAAPLSLSAGGAGAASAPITHSSTTTAVPMDTDLVVEPSFPEGVVNVDALDAANPACVPDYVGTIYSHYKSEEVSGWA